jgi:hypothetical protein
LLTWLIQPAAGPFILTDGKTLYQPVFFAFSRLYEALLSPRCSAGSPSGRRAGL